MPFWKNANRISENLPADPETKCKVNDGAPNFSLAISLKLVRLFSHSEQF